MSKEPDDVLVTTDIVKHYGATCALRGASLRLRAGRVHALLGENGAGKSTLVKIIVGAIRPDSGMVAVAGAAVLLRSVAEAIAAGIVPIYQHLSLFPELSVHENLSAFALAAANRHLVRSTLISRHEAEGWLKEVGLSLDLDTPVASLSLGERQLLEIARGLGQNCRILVLDEPTAALNAEEAERLFTVIRRLCAGGTAVLFISHKFDEIEALADDITVLRDGRTVIDGVSADTLSREEMVRAMLGAAVNISQAPVRVKGTPVLQAEGLRLNHGSPVELAVHSGEIVGLAGLIGSGALSLAAAMAGALPATGKVRVGERIFNAGDREAATRFGIGYAPSDRHAEGLFPAVTAVRNASASALRRFTSGGIIRRRREMEAIGPLLRRLNLLPFDLDMEAGAFSGGNQQKLLIARCLALPDLRALILLEPTRGVDIAARAIIHNAIVEASQRGVAVLLASSDLDELMLLSHRYIVVRDGDIAAELPRGTDNASLLAALAGRVAA
jgi:ABC-type sugar transport system ATPase subunit